MSKETQMNDKDDEKWEVVIYVNTAEKPWTEKFITFEQVVVLAFGQIENNPDVTYTVTYKRGDDHKPEGSLVKGEKVRVKDKMRFNATRANRS